MDAEAARSELHKFRLTLPPQKVLLTDMKRHWQKLGPVIVIGIFAAAAWLLFRELKQYHLRDIRGAIAAIPHWRLLASAGLTIANYLVLIGYDYLAIRAIGHPLPLGKVALGSFVGFATSYNFGPLLGGTSVRYRLYTSWGLSAVEIVQLMVMLGITFWMGIFALAGVLFVAQPCPVPEMLHLPVDNARPLGLILLSVVSIYVALTSIRRQPLRFRDTQIQLPGIRMTLMQFVVAATDLSVSAASLYVLVAHDLQIGYGEFLGMYLLAIVAVIITNVPGGVGVFELIVLTLAAPNSSSSASLVAALLLFRLIYYLLPLLLALLLLAANEVTLHRTVAARIWSEFRQSTGATLSNVLAWLTFAAGVGLLFSGAIPMAHARLYPLPLPLVEVSHFIGSLVGAGFLILARGLQRRLDSAWWITVGLLTLGIAASLLRGPDLIEALALTTLLAALIGCRRRFYRRGSLIHQPLTAGWITALLLTVLCTIWLGLFVHKHVEYSADLWWKFTLRGDVSRFMRASVGTVAVLLLYALRKLLSARPPKPSGPTDEELAAVVPIVCNSPATSANLALLGDKSLLFNAENNAFIMYGIHDRSWVAMGDPVGLPEQRSELVWDFRELVDCYDGWPVFYQVGEDNLTIYLDQGLSLLKLGEEAKVDLTSFSLEGHTRKGLRQTHNRCQREALDFELLPATDIPDLLTELRDVSDAWLADKQTQEKGFSLGFFQEKYLGHFPCAVVRQHARILGFANVWCGGGREELSIDLMRHLPEAPLGVMEYLFVELMLWGRQQGYRCFNLGMAPFSGIENRPLAPLWNRAVNLVFRYGEHFYNFEGLRQYKEKFDPIWTPKYLASPGGLALPRILADVAALIQKGHEEQEEPLPELQQADL